MKSSDKLLSLAAWLESPNNELLMEAERDEEKLAVVAAALVEAAEVLRVRAEEIQDTETETSELTPQALEEMAALAAEFDASGDELLKKQASVLDEILLTIAYPKNTVYAQKKAEDDRIEQLKKKYNETREEQVKMDKRSESEKLIEKAPAMKQYRPLEFPLDTRSCPDHPGAQMTRIGEGNYACSLDNKVYDYRNGFTLQNGNKVPGTSIDQQTKVIQEQGHTIFNTRDGALGL